MSIPANGDAFTFHLKTPEDDEPVWVLKAEPGIKIHAQTRDGTTTYALEQRTHGGPPKHIDTFLTLRIARRAAVELGAGLHNRT